MEIELPLDTHGFLRRQCPACQREFKWHNGPLENAPEGADDVDVYYCPYCGEPADVDEWWTEEQVELIQSVVLDEVASDAAQSLEGAARDLNSSGIIGVSVRYDPPNPPAPLDESDDMTAVASPCHAYEPVKIAKDWQSRIHCLVCGAPYQV